MERFRHTVRVGVHGHSRGLQFEVPFACHNGMQQLEHNPLVKRVVATFDSDKSGEVCRSLSVDSDGRFAFQVDFEEFIAALSVFATPSGKDEKFKCAKIYARVPIQCSCLREQSPSRFMTWTVTASSPMPIWSASFLVSCLLPSLNDALATQTVPRAQGDGGQQSERCAAAAAGGSDNSAGTAAARATAFASFSPKPVWFSFWSSLRRVTKTKMESCRTPSLSRCRFSLACR